MSDRRQSVLAGVQLHLVDSIDEAMALKRWLGERRETPLAIDTESTGLSPYRDSLRLVQFGDLHHGWAVPWPLWGGVVQEVLNAYDGDLVMHNRPFDARFLQRHAAWSVPWHRIDDTMVIAALIDPLGPKGLKARAKRDVDPTAVAGEKLLHDGMAKQKWTWATVPYSFGPYWLYGALDPVLTAHLWLKGHGQVMAECPTAYDLELATQRVCANMMDSGMLVDLEYARTESGKLREFSSQARDWLSAIHGVTSPLSAAQIGRALTALGAEILDRTPNGQPKMDKATLEAYKLHPDERVSQLATYVLAVRHAEKIAGTYLDNFAELVDENGRLHASINTLAARTGRMSVSEPSLQNLPRDDKVVRGSFIPADGMALISCDLDQVEARMTAHFSHDAGLIQAFLDADQHGADFFCGVASGIFGEPIVKGDPRRQLTKNVVYGCVPLDRQILTKRGWLSHHEVEIGDETIGYDPEIGASRWTKIIAVHHYSSAELVRISNAHQSYVTTPNHRWYGSRRSDEWRNPTWEDGFFTTAEINHDTRIMLAAPLVTDATLPITDDEAAILGWLFSDGNLTVNYEIGGKSQSNGTKRMVSGHIRQSMKKHARLIDELLARAQVPHARDVRNGDYVTWRLRGPWLRDLIQRAGSFYDEWPNAVSFASTLSSSQAAAMLIAMRLADGDTFTKTKPWQVDLVVALTYMSGEMPYERWSKPNESGSGWTKKACAKVHRQAPRFTGQRTTIERLPDGPVWCVTTELGTWTMRTPDTKGTRVVLTGNSIYGAGAATMARTAGVPVEQMRPVKDAFDATYPGIKRLNDAIITNAKNHAQPSVFTPTGRRLVADDARAYTQLLNALIQGHAAEYLKMRLVDLDAAGLGPYLRLPIHDEVIAEVPAAEVDDYRREIERLMSDRQNYRVPITAGGKVMTERWSK